MQITVDGLWSAKKSQSQWPKWMIEYQYICINVTSVIAITH